MALPNEQDTSFKHELERYNTGEIPELDTVIRDVKALAARQTFSISYLISNKGEHTILNSRRHLRVKVLQAWIEVKDNSDRDQNIEIVGLCKPQPVASSYRAGVAIPLTLFRNTEISFYKSINIIAKTDKLVTVNLLCESTEVQP